MGWEGFSLELSLVLASLSAIRPPWLLSTVSMAGLTLPCVISIVASPKVGLAGAAFPPKLICLKNQFPGRAFGGSLDGAGLAATGTGGKPAFLGGECPLLGAGEWFGVLCIDFGVAFESPDLPRRCMMGRVPSAVVFPNSFCRRSTSARGTTGGLLPSGKRWELLRGEWSSVLCNLACGGRCMVRSGDSRVLLPVNVRVLR